MDDPHDISSQTAESKNILPDVVHSQQIPSVGDVTDESGAAAAQPEDDLIVQDVEDTLTESISEHIPSKAEYLTDSDHEESNKLLTVDMGQEKVSKNSLISQPFPRSPVSDQPSTQDHSKVESWPLDINAVSDIHLLSEESPINLASTDASKEVTQEKSEVDSPKQLEDSPEESPRSDNYLDSLNEESSKKSDVSQLDKQNSSNEQSPAKSSSGSEEIIKLDIRGQGAPKFPLSSAKIIFGPPPEGSTIIEPNMNPIPVFPNLLSPFLVGASENVKVEEIFDDTPPEQSLEQSIECDITPPKLSLGNSGDSDEIVPDKSGDFDVLKPETLNLEMPTNLPVFEFPEVTKRSEIISHLTSEKSKISPIPEVLEQSLESKESLSNKIEQSDLLVEEIVVDDELKEKNKLDSSPMKSMPAEETMSFSTMTTDYKTICEEYHTKLVHLEEAITQRDDLIEELTISLQQSVRDRKQLRIENDVLTNEVQTLQQTLGDLSEHDTIKAQLSDFVKYQSLIKDDSTKFYSALMSGESSVRSSNGERDNDREEITVNYSRSDLKSSENSDDFQTGFEGKIGTIINKFDEYIEENLRNKLRESLIQVLCDEIGKMRIDYDTEVKEMETQLKQDKQAYSVETRKLRELLASVKAGSVDIEDLRKELSIKHEKEMENLRTYFEKKCSDMERSYSEEVWRGRCASLTGSASSLEASTEAGGDHVRRRTRSAELPSLSLESTPVEQAARQIGKKYEQQIEEMRTEHVAYVNEMQARQREALAGMEDQISQLKLIIQNTESHVLYPQDIDLELEKKMETQLEQRLDEVREEVRQEVVTHLQEQLQVLLSDPDAEVSSWPLELVALRDKIYTDSKGVQEKELSSLRDELSAGEDKWKQRRNHSFDQNRHLEEVTKERDDLKRVAVSLHRAVGQLVAYCATAEDELNRTVLAKLLPTLLQQDSDINITFEADSRACSPNLTADLNTSAVSRSGGKHVHFAPDLNAILDLDEDGIIGYLQQQRDVSADIKKELEHSLRRLRHEAHSLLDLSSKLSIKNNPEANMLESSVQITELVQDLESKNCDNCELHRKNMEEAMTECLQRENLLRSDLEAAMMKIAQLMTSADVIAEGYGTCGAIQPSDTRISRRSSSEPATNSADNSPRHEHRMIVDSIAKERDDLMQQLEAANRQLKSTRQFVEEQAAEREHERDDYVRSLTELREENARLAARLQTNVRIMSEMRCLRLSYCNCREHDAHVEQLETQTREMNQIISELETRKAITDNELKASEEKIIILRDIIANLESQVEQKSLHEKEIIEQLEKMKQTIDERDGKMRSLLNELESAKSERADTSDVMCLKCGQEEDRCSELMDRFREQCRFLEEAINRRTRKLERIHDVSSASCSEPSEDVSIRDQKDLLDSSPESPRPPRLSDLQGAWDSVCALARAEDAALKRLQDVDMQRQQLKDIAQEVRAERDVLQARMSEQALKISSLSARLQQQRNDADALAHNATSQLTVELHDTRAEVQKLKEDLDAKDKQLARLKQNIEEKDKLNEQYHSLYGNSCNPKDKVIILERELSSAQTRIAQLELLVRSLEQDKDELHVTVRDHQRALAEKEDQLQELLALKLDEENQIDEKSDAYEAKVSARTLSDIVSISEFDEQDLQMRRAEIKAHFNLSEAPFPDGRDKSSFNRTLPPHVQNPNISSLNLEYDHYDIPNFTPRADSLPAHLTSTQNKDLLKEYKRNVNETTMFGNQEKEKLAAQIQDNCSMYPNRNVDQTKDNTVEPKKINFSLEPTIDNKTNDEEFTSLRELGITLDIKQENFPDILTQLKHEIKKSKGELETCKSELKNAEEQLCEFPALKEEVEELKCLLENTMATMENDKKFYENQLDNFSSNKTLLEQRLTELTQEVQEKSKDLHLLKEDLLRRENMILELAKEKRNLTNKMTELEVKIDELQSKTNSLEKYESESLQLRDKVSELQKLEQLVTEKNQQIDSLNQHLDRFDDLQRRLNDKNEEYDNLKEAFDEKSNQVFHLQDTVDALNRDMTKINEDNDKLNASNKELTLKLTKLEKEQENASLKLQSSVTELERVNSLNNEMSLKIEELKLLTDKLKDKETEIEILHEDINSFHEEIASLKEQLKMVSRSPSPRKIGEEKKNGDRQLSADKKQLVKIRKQISLLQHELDFNKKELNDQAFELAKAKLDMTDLKTSLSQSNKLTSDKETENMELRQQNDMLTQQLHQLYEEKQQVVQQLEVVVGRLREEGNISELRTKLKDRTERCQELEVELQDMRELVARVGGGGGGGGAGAGGDRSLAVRSPTAELERAVRDQLDYSHTLDEDIMEQILSASSDEREDIPRLALNTSKSSSSIHSSSSERLQRLRSDNEKLQMQLTHLESRLQDKDALITELNRVRDKLVQDWQSSKLRFETERENCARLQLLLDTHKETSQSLQNQDTNMIGILKKRLESSMQSELELQQREGEARAKIALLQQQLVDRNVGQNDSIVGQLQAEIEAKERLSSELSLLKSKLEVEKARTIDALSALEQVRADGRREREQREHVTAALRGELAENKRLKHEANIELLRMRELMNTQAAAIVEMEKKLSSRQKPMNDALLTEIECHKSDLARELASLRQCVAETGNGELQTLRTERQQLTEQLRRLKNEMQARPADDKDQAIRYLHGRCLRLESCRKALVWQKRYLQRVVAGYTALERTLRLSDKREPRPSKFKCAVTLVIAVLRMRFLVSRRQHVRTVAAAALLRTPAHNDNDSSQGVGTPVNRNYPPMAETLARRVMKQELRAHLPPSPGVDFLRRSPYNNSPREEPFILSSPRGEIAAAYLNKLERVSRCLSSALDAPRDVP